MGAIVDLSHPITDGLVDLPGAARPGDHGSPHARWHRVSATRRATSSRSGTSRWCRTPARTWTRRSTASPTVTTSPASTSPGWSAVPGLLVDATGCPGGARCLDGLDVAGRAVLFHTGWDRHWAHGRLRRRRPPVRRHGRRRATGRGRCGGRRHRLGEHRRHAAPASGRCTRRCSAPASRSSSTCAASAASSAVVHVHRGSAGGGRHGDVPGAPRSPSSELSGRSAQPSADGGPLEVRRVEAPAAAADGRHRVGPEVPADLHEHRVAAPFAEAVEAGELGELTAADDAVVVGHQHGEHGPLLRAEANHGGCVRLAQSRSGAGHCGDGMERPFHGCSPLVNRL